MTVPWQDPPARYKQVNMERNVPARMRDGTVLYSDVYRPAGEGPWPVLLMRHPYDKTQAQNICYAHPAWYACHGYLVVIQDCRGRWLSEGEWYPFKYEETDGIDTVLWAAGLPGSNGRVAMYGFSYGGATQLLTAVNRPQPLAAVIPAFTASDYYDGWFYRGGAFQHAFAISWSAQLAQDTARRRGDYVLEEDIAGALRNAWSRYWAGPQINPLVRDETIIRYYYDWLRHDVDDEYWRQWSIRTRYEKITVPALHIAGWYDIFLDGTLENFTGLQEKAGSEKARLSQKLVIGPWYHMPWHRKVGGEDLGEEAGNCVDALQIHWLNKVMLGQKNQLETEPGVAYFVLGMNRWQFADEWPPRKSKEERYYLHSGGRANSLQGDGRMDRNVPGDEPEDLYTYDPRNPAFSLGGRSGCLDALTPMGRYDQKPQELRNGMLVYTSRVLESELLVIGRIEAKLYAAATVTDTDFVARLTDVYPDGRSMNVVDGIIRARFRESYTHPTALRPGAVYEYKINLGSTAYLFNEGHRIRLEITSSNFPAYDRHTNSAKPLAQATAADWQVSTVTVYHSNSYPSSITLPVITR